VSFDIYGLTRHRDLDTINRFLDEYVDRAKSDLHGDDEIGLEPLNPAVEGNAWQWEPAVSLTHIVERGLAHPRRAFTSYLDSKRADIERVMLGFTRDDQVVLGFSAEPRYSDSEELEDARVRQMLADLAGAYHCHLGLILLETPPPLSEADFRAAPEELPTNYFVEYDAD
jgi:hypothetical protein